MANTKDTINRLWTGLHKAIFDGTKGRIAGTAFGMPVVKLTTTGRSSGQARTTMLTSPVQEGGTVVLVASYGGDDRDPQWYKNLLATPEATITMRGSTRSVRARTATTDEKADLWPRVVEAYKGYAGYQTKTDRDIPLVLLDPA
jgi:deazaflavin-dependent oxidoreductase (nitroreductase family)